MPVSCRPLPWGCLPEAVGAGDRPVGRSVGPSPLLGMRRLPLLCLGLLAVARAAAGEEFLLPGLHVEEPPLTRPAEPVSYPKSSSPLSPTSSSPPTQGTSTQRQGNKDKRYHVWSVEFKRVETPFMIGLWIFCSSIAKIGEPSSCHYLPVLLRSADRPTTRRL